MSKFALGILVTTLAFTGAQAVIDVQSCDAKREKGESQCRQQGNRYLSQLSECQVRVNRDYANCAKRFASIPH